MRMCPQCELLTELPVCPDDGRPTISQQDLSIVSVDPLLDRIIAGKYRIAERLGRGGFGAVYRAVHITTGGEAAIKVIRSDLVGDSGAVRRFYVEAQNTHQLTHPNTVRVSDFGRTDDGTLYLIMEYVKGRPLNEEIKAGAMSAKRAVRIITQVLKSLGEAHGHGLVHRDIKPANIMLIDQVGEPDFVKLLDFGIARNVDSVSSSSIGIAGTPRYMAPEQWLDLELDARVDLYAVGCVFHELLTGQAPFYVKAGRREQVSVLYMHKHLKEASPRLAEVAPNNATPALQDFVDLLLSKKRDDRPPTAIAALALLKKVTPAIELEGLVPPQTDTAQEVTLGPAVSALALPGEATMTLQSGQSESTGAPLSNRPGRSRRSVLGFVAAAVAVVAVALLAVGVGGTGSKDGTSEAAGVQADPVQAPIGETLPRRDTAEPRPKAIAGLAPNLGDPGKPVVDAGLHADVASQPDVGATGDGTLGAPVIAPDLPTVTVQTAPPGATVYARGGADDGAVLGQTPLTTTKANAGRQVLVKLENHYAVDAVLQSPDAAKEIPLLPHIRLRLKGRSGARVSVEIVGKRGSRQKVNEFTPDGALLPKTIAVGLAEGAKIKVSASRSRYQRKSRVLAPSSLTNGGLDWTLGAWRFKLPE